ncbi:hypothetical protein YS40_077 [Thermus phage phiYS40]|uniref:hypothetical protein n=1 Tax=Thermus phage phiYS40 TaxID=407392 RepID=UPI0000E689C3|nr:hypothetical protein YS40_077 [Thermus phage phiYS40]ABJ91471.1 hypothetical protein YS40_077 [Thermus phage phiYS40]BAK53595.1 hypothetical protein YSP_077 [Thermus phage phiYS40]
MGLVYDYNNTYTDNSPFDKVKVVPEGKVLYKESNPTRSVYFQGQKTTKHGIAIETENGWHLVDVEEYLNRFGNALDEEQLNTISKIYNIDISQYLQQEEISPEETKIEEKTTEQKEEVSVERQEEIKELQQELAEEKTEEVVDVLEEQLKEGSEALEEISEELESKEISTKEAEVLENQRQLEIQAIKNDLLEAISQLAEERLKEGNPLKLSEAKDLYESLDKKSKEILDELKEFFTLEDLISEANKKLIESKFDEFVEQFFPNDLDEDKESNLEKLENALDKVKEALFELRGLFNEEDLGKLVNLAKEKFDEFKETFASAQDLSEEIKEELIDEALDKVLEPKETSPEKLYQESIEYLDKSQEDYKEHIDKITQFFLGQSFADFNFSSLMKNVESLGFERTLTALANTFAGLLALNNSLEPLDIYQALELMKDFSKRGKTYEILQDLCISYSMDLEYSKRGYQSFKEEARSASSLCENKLGGLAFFIDAFLPQYETQLVHGYFRFVPNINKVLQHTTSELIKLADQKDLPKQIFNPLVRSSLIKRMLAEKEKEYEELLNQAEIQRQIEEQQIKELSKSIRLPEKLEEIFEDLPSAIRELINHSPETKIGIGDVEENLANLALLAGMFDRFDGTLKVVLNDDTDRALSGLLYQASTYLDAVKERYSTQLKAKSESVRDFDKQVFAEALKVLIDSYVCAEGESKEACTNRLNATLLSKVKESVRNLAFLPKEGKLFNAQNLKTDEFGNIVYENHSEPNKEWEIESYLDSFVNRFRDLASSIVAYHLFDQYNPNVEELSKKISEIEQAKGMPLETYLEQEIEGVEDNVRLNEVLREISSIFTDITTKEDLDTLVFGTAPYVYKINTFMKEVFGKYDGTKEYSFSNKFEDIVPYSEFEDYEDAIFNILKTKVPKENLLYLFDDFSPNVIHTQTPPIVFEEEIPAIGEEEQPSLTEETSSIPEAPLEKVSYKEVAFEDLENLEKTLDKGEFLTLYVDEDKEVEIKKIGNKLSFAFKSNDKIIGTLQLEDLKKLGKEFKKAVDEAFETISEATSQEKLLNSSIEQLNKAIKEKKKSKKKAKKKIKEKEETPSEETRAEEAVETASQTEEVPEATPSVEEASEEARKTETRASSKKAKSDKTKKTSSDKQREKAKEFAKENLEQQASEVVLVEENKEAVEEVEKSLSDEKEEYYSSLINLFSSPSTISYVAEAIQQAVDFDPEVEKDIKGLIYFGIFNPKNLDKVSPYFVSIDNAYAYLVDFEKAYNEDEDFKSLVDVSYEILDEYSSSTKKESLRATAEKVFKQSKNPLARSVAQTILQRTSDESYISDRIKRKIRSETYAELFKKISKSNEYIEMPLTDKISLEVITDEKGKPEVATFKFAESEENEHYLALDDTDNPLFSNNLLIIYAALENPNVEGYLPYFSRMLFESDFEFSLENFSFGKKSLGERGFYYIREGEKTKVYSRTSDFLAEAFAIVDTLRPNTEAESIQEEETTEAQQEEQQKSSEAKKENRKKEKKKSKSKKKPKGKKDVVDVNVTEEGIQTTIQTEDEQGFIQQEKVNISPDKAIVSLTNRVLKKFNLPILPYEKDEELLKEAEKIAENIEKEKARVSEDKRLIYYSDTNEILDALLEFVLQERPEDKELRVLAKDVIKSYSGNKFKEKLAKSLIPKIVAVYDLSEEDLSSLIEGLDFPDKIDAYQYKINKNNLSTSVVEDFKKIVKDALSRVGIEASESFILDELIKAFVEITR